MNFHSWREKAREALRSGTAPGSVVWESGQAGLFEAETVSAPAQRTTIQIPRAFLDHAQVVALHRDPDRWELLYRIAWRIQDENAHLLHIEVDDDIRNLLMMRKSIERDIHKMRAFVRFRRVEHEGQEQFVAWYPPDHHILEANERFFVDRFGAMRWAILTPEASLLWDLEKVQYGPGVPRSEAPAEDQFDDLWRTYYSSIYNPARLNLDAMRAQLPVRRWVDLPESRTIPELVRMSRERVETMAKTQPVSAAKFIPPNAGLPELREAVKQCSACELCAMATQPVFGEGPGAARILLVGEQPGNEEDLAGRPFVGPAGKVLMAALEEAGLDRAQIYLTNAVKAFRFEERGKRRIHQKPGASHIAACRPWLDAEIANVRPGRIVCLGATAAQSVFGRVTQIKAERGRTTQHASGAQIVVTYHPSAILRTPDEAAKAEMMKALIADLAG